MKQDEPFWGEYNFLVNPCNQVGVMGAGFSLALKQRWPMLAENFRQLCTQGQVYPGHIPVSRVSATQWVLHLTTKRHWREAAQWHFVETGVTTLRGMFESERFRAFAGRWERAGKQLTLGVPLLGAGLGQLDWQQVYTFLVGELREARWPAHLTVSIFDKSGVLMSPLEPHYC